MGDSKKGIQRGQAITFRIPSDTPDYVLKQLQHLKETEKRNFSSRIAQYVMQGVSETRSKEKETVTVSLPKSLTKEQRNWLKHEHSEALMGSILYQLLMDPIRATSLYASLHNNAYDFDDVLELQEQVESAIQAKSYAVASGQDNASSYTNDWRENESPAEDNWTTDDDLDDINLDHLQEEIHKEEEKVEFDEDDPLADFFSSMNK
ncbi:MULTISPECIES: hypothetical protein [Pontibacillus]|uniref:Uncharacterized protein n=1 Tax=Pontibacillus chungwhensis TaxID=265426 RepID=A0ABY8UX85_9BACI|nr:MULTISPECIES: hypothetical protein [Pontibacillus]MCD5325649.1 hypothetical protein [Pontibacillus sp. HN14]WIF98104.1 hypothetical protein QNI29_20685 [Pontibacillus chungwhensis]